MSNQEDIIVVEHYGVAEFLKVLQPLLKSGYSLDFESNEVIFNTLKIQVLGYSLDEIPQPTPYSFFTALLHPDDYLPVMKILK